MTALAFYFDDTIAAIASDTQSCIRNEDSATQIDGTLTKIFSAPHLHLAVLCSGEKLPLIWLEQEIVHSTRIGDVDDLASDLPDILPRLVSRFESGASEAGLDVSCRSDLYLVGWSRRDRKMHAYLATASEKYQSNGATPLRPGMYKSPAFESAQPIKGRTKIPADFVAAITEAYERQFEPGVYFADGGSTDQPVVGGDIMLTLLTSMEIRHTHIGRLPNASALSAWSDKAARAMGRAND